MSFFMWFSTCSLEKLIQRKLILPQLFFVSVCDILSFFISLPIVENCHILMVQILVSAIIKATSDEVKNNSQQFC